MIPIQIAGFGAVAIDELIYVDRPLHLEKGRVTARQKAHGGNVATALAAVSALGAKASFIGWVSDHPDFVESLDDLQKHGVETSRAPFNAEATPVKSVIVVGADGERFIAFDDKAPIGTSSDLNSERLGGASVLLIDSYAVSSLEAVQAAKDAGVSVVADIEWSVGDETHKLMALCDHLVLPWQFAEEVTCESAVQKIIDKLWTSNRSAVVITKGGLGAFLKEDGEDVIWHQPAHQVAVTDSTGAGDCFHGAYCFGLAEGYSFKDCVRFANAAAALSTTKFGGRGLLPDMETVETLLTSSNAPSLRALD